MTGADAAAEWQALLGPDETAPAFCSALATRMRDARLTFGDRLHCPFLRPFFLRQEEERRIRLASETLAALGERVVRAALESAAIFARLGVTEPEERLIRLDPGYDRASTASRVDAFLLPDSVRFAEYNAESPAGPGYTQRLCELFDTLAVMRRFREGRRVRFHHTIPALLDALLASYRDWGGRAQPPTMAIVDWREVPTRTEFDILAEAFTAAGVPTFVCDPRELEFRNGQLTGNGRRIDFVYRRVLVNDIVARPGECAALVSACAAQAVPVANTFRCKLAHKKAFFAVLTDPAYASLFSSAERALISAHVPWTRVLADESVEKDGRRWSVAEYAAARRESLVLKPNDEYGGKGVMLGWEAGSGEWAAAVEGALADPPGSWIVQERIAVRRERFAGFDDEGRVTEREMLVDLAPYLFRGRLSGYLARLSATGLANVTSGGGQVPVFVVAD